MECSLFMLMNIFSITQSIIYYKWDYVVTEGQGKSIEGPQLCIGANKGKLQTHDKSEVCYSRQRE